MLNHNKTRKDISTFYSKEKIKPSKSKRSISSLKPIALALSLAFGATSFHTVQAATFTVDNTNDVGLGSLRQAVIDANASAGADSIEFNSALSGSTIALTSGEITITEALTISGPDAGNKESITLDAQENSRHFNASIVTGDLTLENMTLKYGSIDTEGEETGGSIVMNGGDLILNNTLITYNNTFGEGVDVPGGAISLNNGNAIITNSTISNNTTYSVAAGGGAIAVFGNLTLNQSQVSNNYVQGTDSNGGGILVSGGDLQLNQSVVFQNRTYYQDSSGGGIAVIEGNATINKSTISRNYTNYNNSPGGGISVKDGNLNITQSTISSNNTSNSNSQGGGLFVENGDLSLTESTISDNFTSYIDSHGGGIAVKNGNITVTQSTISNNRVDGSYSSGGGIELIIGNTSPGNILINQSTISKNSANSAYGAGGISTYIQSGSSLILKNTILSDNTGIEGNLQNKNLAVGANISFYNTVFGDPIFEITGVNSNNIYNNSPLLGPLQHNGGLTQTHKPLSNSPAIDMGDNTFATNYSNDQRSNGFSRIANSTVEIGSVEILSTSNNPNEVITRGDLARELLKAVKGSSWTPPPANGEEFDDVNVGDVNADWIEYMGSFGFSEGCDDNSFCPEMIVTKEQMAKVFLKTIEVSPDAPAGIFTDVPVGSFAEEYINTLSVLNYTEGCDVGKFCPKQAVTKEWFDKIIAIYD